jgi:hypothetical protein
MSLSRPELERLLDVAKPKRVKAAGWNNLPAGGAWVWYGSGSPSADASPERGTLPHEVRLALPRGDLDAPPGCGGNWWSSEILAAAALRRAVADLSQPEES